MFNKTHSCAALLLAAAVPATALADFSFYLGVGGGGSRIERDDINLDFKVITTNVINGFGPYSSGAALTPGGIFSADPFPRVNDPAGTDFAWKVFGGARYGRHLGLEVGYIDLGEAEDSFEYLIPEIRRNASNPNPPPTFIPGDLTRPDQDRQIEVETAIDGMLVAAMGYLPVGERFELFGKVGLIRWDRKTQVLERVLEFTPVSQPGAPDTRLYTGGRDPVTGEPLESFVLSGPGKNLFTCFPSPVSDGSGGQQPRALDAECSGLLPNRSDSGTDLALGFGVNIKASENVALRAEFEWFDIKGTDLTYAATLSLVFGF
jgi:opacity protein-like surface antigen